MTKRNQLRNVTSLLTTRFKAWLSNSQIHTTRPWIRFAKLHGYGRWWRKFSATYGRSAEVTHKFLNSCRTGLNFCEQGLPIISSCVCYKYILLYNTTKAVIKSFSTVVYYYNFNNNNNNNNI